MCFRLFAAVRAGPGAAPQESLETLGARHGLDVRSGIGSAAGFLEVAWGDCACSLVTRREGWQRAVSFTEALLDQGLRVQLLLFSDGDLPAWDSPAPRPLPLDALRQRGLAALPEGEVAEVHHGSGVVRKVGR